MPEKITQTKRIPLYEEVTYTQPYVIFRAFCDEPWAALLESATHQTLFDNTNRYSYIVTRPFQQIKITQYQDLFAQLPVDDPLAYLRAQMAHFPQEHLKGLPPFQGGALGAMSYELVHYYENIPFAKNNDQEFPDLIMGLYDVVIAFDHLKQQAWIISSGYPMQENQFWQAYAKQQLANYHCKYLAALTQPFAPFKIDMTYSIHSNFNQTRYCEAVESAKEYIRAGDIFEVNLAQRFTAQFNSHPYSLYESLRQVSPAPFAAYLNLDDYQIISSSPERFLSVHEHTVQTRPIKGTRKRSQNPDEDSQLALELQQSRKDRRENIMIVDLMRNDFSKVCQPDSIHVSSLCQLESNTTVHHLVSIISGILNEHHDNYHLLRACIPAGSISGAPKIRAMQIIAQLEPHVRGAYCGSLGYLSFTGCMETSVSIRTFLIHQQCATYHAGGAIVLDSDALLEYDETLVKAKACFLALQNDSEGTKS